MLRLSWAVTIPKKVATFVYASSQGQRTHSARTKINQKKSYGFGVLRISKKGFINNKLILIFKNQRKIIRLWNHKHVNIVFYLSEEYSCLPNKVDCFYHPHLPCPAQVWTSPPTGQLLTEDEA